MQLRRKRYGGGFELRGLNRFRSLAALVASRWTPSGARADY